MTSDRSQADGSAGTKGRAKKRAAKAPTLYVGIDLGTSQSAIAGSNGHRSLLRTYVGRPKDTVAEKLFGKRLLFGDEALHNRMSLELFRPLEKGVIKDTADDVEAVQALLKHLVSLVQPAEGEVIHGVVGAPAQASVRDKKTIIEAVQGVFDAVMVVSEPFCVAYGIEVLSDALIVDIGAGTMDLCRMRGTLPAEEDQVTIDKAGDFIDRRLFELVRGRYPEAQVNINMLRGIKERYGYVSEVDDKVEVEFTVAGRPRRFDITEQLRDACLGIIPDLTDALYHLIGSFDPEFQKRLREQVIVGGGGSQMTGLARLVERALEELGGGSVRIVDEPAFAGATGALMIAREMPDAFWEHLS